MEISKIIVCNGRYVEVGRKYRRDMFMTMYEDENGFLQWKKNVEIPSGYRWKTVRYYFSQYGEGNIPSEFDTIVLEKKY